MEEDEAQKVLHNFYTDNVPESISDRHLLNAGRAIVPYLIVEIQKKDMPRRRYAIGALEKIGDHRAVPILTSILENESEEFYFRNDAFRAIWHINRRLGEELAQKYSGKIIDIDSTIQSLRDGKI